MPALDFRTESLNMTNEAIFARQDLAYSMRRRGLSISLIARECKYNSESSVYRAIKAGELRALAHENRVSQRKFGVEIEFNRTSRESARDEIANLDSALEVNIEGYNHTVRPHWKLITDSSVNGTGTGRGNDCGCDPEDDCDCENDDGQGLEMVSPILTGRQGFRELETVLKGIRGAGGGIDSSCGLHVHHDARDMETEQIVHMLVFYMDNQLVIDKLLAPSRRTANYNQWCRPWSESEKGMVVMSARENRLRGGFDRYKTINVTSFPRYGSIEFRQHQGTLNFSKISNWVRFGQSVVEASIKLGGSSEPIIFTEVEPMLAHLHSEGRLPESSAEYLLRRSINYGA